MRTYRLLGVAATLAVVSFTFVPSIASSGSSAGSAGAYAPVCLPAAASGVANCDAIQLLNPGVNWHGTHVPVGNNGKGPGKRPGGGGGGGSGGTPSGYRPSDLWSAYALTTDSANYGKGQTVAIVDAYNDPNALQDVSTYRSQWGIKSFTAGQFQQVDQNGPSYRLPANSTSWSEEISLDLDMVSAICPQCNILLVEANSASIANLSAAAAYAADNANVVSNSYGANEFSGETSYDGSYSHPGVVFTASAGDSGYGVEYPAASPNVTAVGGTTLTGSQSSTWTQTVWSGTGSGCSTYEPIPAWQPPSNSLCNGRTVADTAAVADPNTGVAVYDSFHEPGWMVFGGTSVASPLVASIYALAGNTSSVTAENLYLDSAKLNHVIYGSNSSGCTNYLCNAQDSVTYKYNGSSITYNGPTGVGTPIGTAGF